VVRGLQPLQASQRQPPQRRSGRPSDFSDEYVNRRVALRMHDGTVIEGLMLEARRFWFKIKDSSTKLIYVNKGFVVAVEVFEEKRR
jgi:hypothetical protein